MKLYIITIINFNFYFLLNIKFINTYKMFGKQQFIGKVDGAISDKYDLIKVIE